MRSKRSVFLATAGLVLAVLPVDAVNREVKPGDYAAIEKRNPFGLVDPPPPKQIVVPTPPVEKEPPPNVELTGMYHDTIRNKTFALFLMEMKGETKKRSYMLSEGEKQDGLKVVQIDRKASNVKINLKGLESTITYTEPKAAAVRKPGRALTMGGNQGRPNFGKPPEAVPAGQVDVQPLRIEGGRVAGGMINTTGTAGGSGKLRAIPPREMRTAQPQLTRQQQAILIEAQRAKNNLLRQQNPGGANVPTMPPLPPTSLTTPEDLQRIVVQPPVPGGQ